MSDAGYEFLDDVAIADIAFRAWGDTLAEVFRQAGRATAAVMVDDLDTIAARERREVALDDTDADMLLLDFLQELIFYKDADRLFLLPESVTIDRREGGYRLAATLAGESIDPDRHPTNADVKAVTLHRFRLERRGGRWEAEVVLDV